MIKVIYKIMNKGDCDRLIQVGYLDFNCKEVDSSDCEKIIEDNIEKEVCVISYEEGSPF